MASRTKLFVCFVFALICAVAWLLIGRGPSADLRADEGTRTDGPEEQTAVSLKGLPTVSGHGHPNVSTDVDVILDGRSNSQVTYSWSSLKKTLAENVARVFEPEDKDFNRHAFNVSASESLFPLRLIPDTRAAACRHRAHSSPMDLPPVSIVIPCYNEVWSIFVRTLHSILRETPAFLLKEIIVVDDQSTLRNMKAPLEKYLRSLPRTTLLRTRKREGLARARLLGAQAASGKVLVFLDAHVEVNKQWLEPLLEEVVRDPKTIAVPMVDYIDTRTLEYKASEAACGTFSWDLIYMWKTVSSRQRADLERGQPVPTATTIGCAMAVDKHHFVHLGGFDDGLDIWGGENLELSFKAWMCGGSLMMVPCSRVGHLFRKNLPYRVNGNSLQKNLQRVAEVWMDEYRKEFYQTAGKVAKFTAAERESLSERRRLREGLNCKSFGWFLDQFPGWPVVPSADAVFSGQLRLALGTLCVTYNNQTSVVMSKCFHVSPEQVFHYNEQHQLVSDSGGVCLSLPNHAAVYVIRAEPCNASEPRQIWAFSAITPPHVDSELSAADMHHSVGQYRLKSLNFKYCLTFTNHKGSVVPGLWECDYNALNQYWTFSHKLNRHIAVPQV